MTKPGYKKTELGCIPDNWEVIKLKDCFKLSSGKTKPIEISESLNAVFQYPIYGGNGILGYSKEFNISDKKIIIGRVGEYCGITRQVEGKYWITDNALYTSKIRKDISIEYLTYKLQKIDLSKQRNKGGQPLISQQPIYFISILLPPLPEQKKIAEILSIWDKAIEKAENLIENKKNLNKGMMQRLFSMKKLKNERVKLDDLCLDFLSGGTPSTNIEDFWKGDIPWITSADIFENKVSKIRRYINVNSIKNSSTHTIEKGNLLIVTRTGVGKIAIAPFRVAFSQDFTGVLPNNKKVKTEYLFFYLVYSSKILQGLNQGTSINGVTQNSLKSLKIKVPSLEKQEKIANYLTSFDKEIELLIKYLTALKEQKKGLMQKLLTGEVRVNVKEESK